MADIAASVLARLKNKAMETGRSNQLCLQLFCQEEYLRRLQRSSYSDNFILKGGLLVYALSDFDSRVTIDIDFLLRKIPNTPEAIQAVIEEIIAIETGNDYVTFEIRKIEPIAVTKKYHGIGASIVARIKNTRTVFGIDFGFGDVIVPGQEKCSIPTQLYGFDAPVVSAYSLESTIAEKLDAILLLMEYSSRMKDYFDIFYLANRLDFCGQTLRKAVADTFINRNRDFTIQQFDQLLALSGDAAMKRKWSAFLKRLKGTEPDFSEVLKTLDVFLRDIVVAVISDEEFTKSWSAVKGIWI